MARKGGVPRPAVLNCLDLPAFAQHLTKRGRGIDDGDRSVLADLNALESVGGKRRCEKKRLHALHYRKGRKNESIMLARKE